MAMLLRLVLSLGLVLPGQPHPHGSPHDSVLARHLYWASLDQRAVLNLDSAMRLLQATRRADPTFFPAQLDYVVLRQTRYEDAALRREAATLVRSPDPIDRCLGLVI